MHCTSKALLKGAFGPALQRSSTTPLSFLLPSFISSQTTSFSTTTPTHARKDHNPSRSVSALRRTGPNRRQTLSVLPKPVFRRKTDPSTGTRLTYAQRLALIPSSLPKPVLDPAQRSAIDVDPDHGLWDFFNEKKAPLFTPLELSEHGRSWTIKELRKKGWDDLWRLWWVCLREVNRLHTFRAEKKRVGSMYGDYEADGRGGAIRKTQKRIKHVLTERWYTWENARVAAMEDDEVNLYADADNGETAYTPKAKGIVAAEAENEKPEHEADELEKQLAGVGRRDLFPPPSTSGAPDARI